MCSSCGQQRHVVPWRQAAPAERGLSAGKLALLVAVCLVWWVALFWAIPVLFSLAAS